MGIPYLEKERVSSSGVKEQFAEDQIMALARELDISEFYLGSPLFLIDSLLCAQIAVPRESGSLFPFLASSKEEIETLATNTERLFKIFSWQVSLEKVAGELKRFSAEEIRAGLISLAPALGGKTVTFDDIQKSWGISPNDFEISSEEFFLDMDRLLQQREISPFLGNLSLRELLESYYSFLTDFPGFDFLEEVDSLEVNIEEPVLSVILKRLYQKRGEDKIFYVRVHNLLKDFPFVPPFGFLYPCYLVQHRVWFEGCLKENGDIIETLRMFFGEVKRTYPAVFEDVGYKLPKELIEELGETNLHFNPKISWSVEDIPRDLSSRNSSSLKHDLVGIKTDVPKPPRSKEEPHKPKNQASVTKEEDKLQNILPEDSGSPSLIALGVPAMAIYALIRASDLSLSGIPIRRIAKTLRPTDLKKVNIALDKLRCVGPVSAQAILRAMGNHPCDENLLLYLKTKAKQL